MNSLAKWWKWYRVCLGRMARELGRDIRRTNHEVQGAVVSLGSVAFLLAYWLAVPFVVSTALLVIYPIVAYRRMALSEAPEEWST